MPIPKNIAKDETVEIRLKIKPSGNFTETQYLRCFQFDGTGTLRYFDEARYLADNSYELKDKEFRL